MFFDFTNMTHNEIDATILHNFGHALGLGHALMTSRDWAHLKKYVDPKKMVKSLNLSQEAELQSLWTGEGAKMPINYDPQSIMRYKLVHNGTIESSLIVWPFTNSLLCQKINV